MISKNMEIIDTVYLKKSLGYVVVCSRASTTAADRAQVGMGLVTRKRLEVG